MHMVQRDLERLRTVADGLAPRRSVWKFFITE
jgi:hypothetical protein